MLKEELSLQKKAQDNDRAIESFRLAAQLDRSSGQRRSSRGLVPGSGGGPRNHGNVGRRRGDRAVADSINGGDGKEDDDDDDDDDAVVDTGGPITIQYVTVDPFLIDQLPSVPSTRSEVESSREYLHEKVFAPWYQEYSKQLDWSSSGPKIGTFTNGSFPPYLGTVSMSSPPNRTTGGIAGGSARPLLWEIRPEYIVPALRWVLRGLVHSGHITALDPLTSDSWQSGVIMTNDVYRCNNSTIDEFGSGPFDIFEANKKTARRKGDGDGDSDDEEEEVEMSEYERQRADRVARNAERLKMLGLG